MTSFLYSATASADGFIAGPGGDMSWLADHFGPDPVVDELMAGVGALLIGARTFRGDDPNRGDPEHEGAFSGQWQGPSVVLTHRPPAQPAGEVTFTDDLSAAVELARNAAGDKPYVNILGADVARQCLDLGVLDEVAVFTVPVLLGQGTRLLDRPGRPAATLQRLRQWHTEHATGAWYRVSSPAARPR
ncbi:MAG TPA: dihydrofolate reductase family protein [Candidatus Ruania gallistercoris]|uniref:Dihydrofolate reductase family protein n=1 Tax=Candidatus Ruania gallistercoris TaxID=2838746 RepID=A0A9D2EI59_9MICO|nr:dihydrofolate reductase family protein [Candidatus Ruania gallistercoris]